MDYTPTDKYLGFLGKSVVIDTYLSSKPVMGLVIEADMYSLTVAPNFSNSGSDYIKSNFDIENTYYLPNNSIISIKLP